ncbi:MAG: hypothetical protein LAQ69_09545 [Acidobacteriia bacterium]|nr:hypothetical protein [Terriglobia bacterium]
MLAFIRGSDPFITKGQLYVKMLPNGEPVRLTNDPDAKGFPAFSPDGSRIAYTHAPARTWDTWVVPVLGGVEPRPLLANASGLTWIGDRQVLFSELRQGIHMPVVTSTEGRGEQRDIYVPPHDVGMAHFSYLSPDREWVLLAEMDGGVWLPCRLVPFAGGSPVRPAGPPACRQAAWSPDGKWMYFIGSAGPGSHIWRQRFPDGPPEQLTSGATEEHGIAVTPDGRSLITASGLSHYSVWVHDSNGDHRISAEGSATVSLWLSSLSPFSQDGKTLYYLTTNASAPKAPPEQRIAPWELWAADLETGRRERLFPDFLMSSFDIARDGSTVAFAAWYAKAKGERLWIGSLDGRSPPRQLSSGVEEHDPIFGVGGELLFTARDGPSNFLYRMKPDGSDRRKALPDPIVFHMSISPDGTWVVARVPVGSEERNSVKALPLGGGRSVTICDFCQPGWSLDGRFFWIRIGGHVTSGQVTSEGEKTFAIPLRAGEIFPPLPEGGIRSEADVKALPGAQLVFDGRAAMGSNPSIYAYSQEIVQRNLFRVPLP